MLIVLFVTASEVQHIHLFLNTVFNGFVHIFYFIYSCLQYIPSNIANQFVFNINLSYNNAHGLCVFFVTENI